MSNSVRAPKVIVRPLRRSDLNVIVELHRSLFPRSRSTSFGPLYLKKMYRWFLEFQPDLCIGIDFEDQLIGFIVGTIGGYGTKVLRFAIGEIIISLLIHPHLILNKNTYSLWNL